MVCLSSGRFSIMAFNVVAKPRSRILSASSKTENKKGNGPVVHNNLSLVRLNNGTCMMCLQNCPSPPCLGLLGVAYPQCHTEILEFDTWEVGWDRPYL